MSAETLRKAATILRERSEKATPGPWRTQAGTSGDPADGPTTYTLTAATGDIATGDYCAHDGCALDYAATMHPGVGLVLADLIDWHVAYWSGPNTDGGPCEAPCTHGDCEETGRLVPIARLIVGEQS